MVLFTTIWRANRETLFFRLVSASTNPQRRRSTVIFNHGSRKTGQAAGAGGLKQDRYVHIGDIRPWVCLLSRMGIADCQRARLVRVSACPCSGGKGTVRRKIVRKSKPSNTQDDKKLQGALKKLNLQPITGVEEVNMFREDGNVLHFSAPKGEWGLTRESFSLSSGYELTIASSCTAPRVFL